MPQDSFTWITIATVSAMLRKIDPNKYAHLETYIDRTQPSIDALLAELPRKQYNFMKIVSEGVRQQRDPRLSQQAEAAALLSKEKKALPGAFHTNGPEPSILKFALFSNGYKTPSLAALTATSLGLSLATSIPELTPLTLGFGSITFASAFWNLHCQFSKIENKWIAQLPRYGAAGTGLYFLYESIPGAAFYYLPSILYSALQYVPYNAAPRIAVFSLVIWSAHQLILNQEHAE